MSRLRFVGAVLAAWLSATFFVDVAGAQSQAYPTKPVRIVVPVATGGTSDVLARVVGGRLQALWGQGVVVENRAGVAGNLGTENVVRSPADGYSLVLQTIAMVTNRAVGTRANFDYEKDLTPIVLMGETPLIIVANPSQGIDSLADLVARARKDPKALSYGSCGIGTPHHLFMELLRRDQGIELNHVAYKGCSPALTDVLGNQVPIAVVTANLAVPYVRDGKLKAIGVSSARRYSALPDVKTVSEQGATNIALTSWHALFGPARLPRNIVTKVQTDVTTVLNDPAVKQLLLEAGIDVTVGDDVALAAIIKSDRARYEAIAKTAHISLD